MIARTSVLVAAAVAALGSPPALAQDTRPRGVPAPAVISIDSVADTALVRLFNSVDVLGRGAAGNPLLFIRVIGTWGPSARLDGDALTTQVYIALNDDGFDMGLYRIGPLLDPNVECIVTESDQPVIHISYGLPQTRLRARIQAALSGLNITEGDAAGC